MTYHGISISCINELKTEKVLRSMIILQSVKISLTIGYCLKVIEHLKKKYLDTGIRQFLFGALNLSCAILLHLHFDKTVAPLKIAFYQYVSEQNYIIPNRT